MATTKNSVVFLLVNVALLVGVFAGMSVGGGATAEAQTTRSTIPTACLNALKDANSAFSLAKDLTTETQPANIRMLTSSLGVLKSVYVEDKGHCKAAFVTH